MIAYSYIACQFLLAVDSSIEIRIEIINHLKVFILFIKLVSNLKRKISV